MATLAAAFDARDHEAPFDLVQSPDSHGCGSDIHPRPGRPHLVRCSIMAELNAVHEQAKPPVFPTWQARYELRAVERAEIAYAPSQFGADYYQKRLHRPVHVVRPPALIEVPPCDVPVAGLPEKYLLHFGTLNPSKGTLWLADALPLAWQREPDLKIVIAGRIFNIDTDALKRQWGPRSANVLFLGRSPSRNFTPFCAALRLRSFPRSSTIFRTPRSKACCLESRSSARAGRASMNWLPTASPASWCRSMM